MSDKERIIINEVDVSGCNYIIAFDLPKEQVTWGGAIHKGACKIYSKDCKYNPDCLFKQLARKTQEAEKYKKLAADFKDVNKQLGYKYLTIKKECEELKKELNGSEKWRIKAESLNEKLSIEKYRYRKALEEIEEYVQSQLDGFGNDVYLMNKAAINKILDIINKAKGNN